MAFLIIAISILLRFAPHPPDFSPVYAALLLSGAVLRKRYSVCFPLLVIALSDVLLTPIVYHVSIGWGQIITWVAFAGTVVCGWLLREKPRSGRMIAAALAGPTVFFVIANFGVWLSGHMYSQSLSGLILCYTAALPFYGHAVASTCTCGVLIGALYGVWIKFFRPDSVLQRA